MSPTRIDCVRAVLASPAAAVSRTAVMTVGISVSKDANCVSLVTERVGSRLETGACGPSRVLFVVCGEDGTGTVPAKPEGVAQRDAHGSAARRAECERQIAVRVRRLDVDRWRHESVLDREDARDRL